MIALSRSLGVAVGIDVAGDDIKVAVGDIGLKLLARRAVRPEHSANGVDPETTLRLIAGVVRETLASAGLDESRVIGGVIAVPAPVDSRGGMVGVSTFLPGWEGSRPAAILESLVGFPILLENDANVSGFAEAVAGSAQGAGQVLYIKASVMLGAGLIINGRVHRGYAGGAGEIAHMIVHQDPGAPLCHCGRRGCLAMVVHGGQMVEEVRDGLRRRLVASEFDPNALDHPGLRALEALDLVVQWALRGDPISARVVSDAGHQLGFAVANVCQILNPEVVVVGGTLTRAGAIFMDPFTEAVHGLTKLLPGWPVPIELGRWQEDAELVGAAALGVRAENGAFAERFSRLTEKALVGRKPDKPLVSTKSLQN
jgi:predicted NBD/HSP70 family sugar kinase